MTFAFLAGLPRSGSSLLASLLNQHPDVHVSPTSGLIDMMVWVRNNWLQNDAFRAQGAEAVTPNVRNMLLGMMEGYYQQYAKKLRIDKNRAWPAYIEMLEDVLGDHVTIICTVRDILAIFASFENLRAYNPLTYPHGVGDEYIQNQSIYGRFDTLMSDRGTIGLSGLRMLDAIQRGLGDRLLIVPYPRLMSDPVSTAVQVFVALGLKPIRVDLDNLAGDGHVNDVDVWGAQLHRVGKEFNAARGVESSVKRFGLPSDLVEMADKRYYGIQTLATQRDIVCGHQLRVKNNALVRAGDNLPAVNG